jgi:hypothetical protein
MIPRDAQTIGHQTPYPRIDLYGPKPCPAQVGPVIGIPIAEQDRIWALVRKTAEGTCAPVAQASPAPLSLLPS